MAINDQPVLHVNHSSGAVAPMPGARGVDARPLLGVRPPKMPMSSSTVEGK